LFGKAGLWITSEALPESMVCNLSQIRRWKLAFDHAMLTAVEVAQQPGQGEKRILFAEYIAD
jgi:hypothetical protein